MMTYGATIGWCILSFTIGWFLGRLLLRLWFHKELDKLQEKVLANTDKLGANNLKILELTTQLQAQVQAMGKPVQGK